VAKAHHASSSDVGHPLSQPVREWLARYGRTVAPLAHEATVGAQVNQASIGQSYGLCHRLPACAHAMLCHLATFPLGSTIQHLNRQRL